MQYFFMSFESDAAAVLADVNQLKTRVDAALASLPQADRDWWTPRFHYITVSARTLPDWLGAFVNNTFLLAHPYFGWAIDRFQRIRSIGLLQDANNTVLCPNDPSTATWEGKISFLANEARHFNFEWYRQTQMASESYTTLDVWQQRFSGNIYTDVTFPDAAEMSQYDTMLFDLSLRCYDSNGDGRVLADDCEWDYLIYAFLCDKDDPDNCGQEMGRWITTYGRDGRWVVDVSPMLAFLRDGGARRMRFYSQNAYDIDFKIHLTNRGKGYRPYAASYLYGGGTFNLNYNPSHPSRDIQVPSYATRTDLVGYVTGHGFGDAANCSEFCNHQHVFTIGGNDYRREHPSAGTAYGCLQQVDQEVDGFSGPGTVPNQFGTWPYGRGGWCPGLDVKPWVEDVTATVQPGTTNTISYRGLFQNQDYDPQPGAGGGFAAQIAMNSWLVYSIKPPEADCNDRSDNDGDGTADCQDPGCWSDPACQDADTDSDGTVNSADCDPLDGGAHARPSLDLLSVGRDPLDGTVSLVTWDDQAAAAGDGTTYDFVTGSLDDLHADRDFNSGQCLDPGTNQYVDARTGQARGYYYFLRARNSCGATSFGTTSFGRGVGTLCY